MKLIFVAAAIAAIAFGQERPAFQGIYTQQQASRGKAIYTQQCASCHGADLNGGEEAPALTGGAFLGNWRSRSVGELFDKVQASMPADRPGSLSLERNA